MTSIRYMGTKRALGPIVRTAISEHGGKGRAADLFSGMGAIAYHLTADRSVFLSDVMAFPTVFARAHCLESTQRTPKKLLADLYPLFREHRSSLRRDFSDRLEAEKAALDDGVPALHKWLVTAPHVGNSASFSRMAAHSRRALSYRKYRLATLYFSAGYFSTSQAIDLDSLRFAIDNLGISKRTAAPALAVWLSAASRIINSPGHSAQYLKPTTDAALRRIRTQLRKDVWATFADAAHAFEPWGSYQWRTRNSVVQDDALNLVSDKLPRDVSIIYADPPYTKDQYSRFYHVFESLLLYDYPSSSGAGRYRESRYASPFCHVSGVAEAFKRLFRGAKAMGLPLVLSYPSDGLLRRAGISIDDFVASYFSLVEVVKVPSSHSTMGGSKGPATKETTECIFICK